MSMSDGAAADLLTAMALVSASDGDTPADELAALHAHYEAAVGRPIDEARLQAVLARASADGDALWKELDARGDALTDPERETILRAVVRIVIADADLAEEELVALQRLARALRFKELRRVMNDVWRAHRAGG